MVLARGNFADLLKPIVQTWFLEGMGTPDPMLEILFNVSSSTNSQEEREGMGARPLVPVFDGTTRYAGFDAGYRKDIRMFEFADGIQIERALVDDDKTGIMRNRATQLGLTLTNTVETDCANIFIQGFTDSGTTRLGDSTNGADGVALLSTAHPHSPVNTGSTQANEGQLALNVDNLDTTRQAMRAFTDDKDQLLGIRPDTLLVPPELQRSATQILSERANFEPGSAEFNVNMFSGGMRMLVWDRLTDANAWFLIDSRQMKLHNHFFWRIDPEFNNTSDFDGLMAKYQSYFRYGIGFDDWRWIYGQNPS